MAIVTPRALIESAYRVKLMFTAPVLGSQPSSPIALEFVRSRQIKALAAELERTENMPKTAALKEAERRVNESSETVLTPEEQAESAVQVTVFHTDDIGPHLQPYQVKGFFKEARQRLDLKVAGKGAGKTASAKQFVEGGLWIYPWDIRHQNRLYFYRDGVEIAEIDDMLERPKRVQLPTGQQATSIAVSEVINPPCELRFDVACVLNHRLKREHVEEMLAYGQFQGLMQWRGAGNGRFVADVEEISPSDVAVAA